MTETLETLAARVQKRLGAAVQTANIANGELTLEVSSAQWVAVISDLQAHEKFSTLVDLTAVDWPARETRFDVVVHLLSMYANLRIRVKCDVAEGQMLDSLIPVYPSANWFEREVFDMFGITFAGHPDLRRILTDYGFTGYPLRKDFPTTGYLEVRYDDLEKKVIYEPVKLVQEYRQFDFMSPWEGAQYILPGDEKTAAPKA
ncbi:MAG: NADH-quinone oxidoreductase subunit C [Deltaproteobacteria bacterium]